MQHQATILQKIVKDKQSYLIERKAKQPLKDFHKHIAPSDRDFYQALKQKRPAYILECKKASPSKGLIRENFDVTEIAQIYRNYASAISVLTDEKYFQGDFEFLQKVKDTAFQPILCKDFFIDEYQIYLARFYGADAILLMLSVLDDENYQKLADLAHQLKMGVLTEVATTEEFQRAINLKAKVIGVNNRNLHDLSIDLNRTIELTTKFAEQIPSETIIISESGIFNNQHIKKLQHNAQGFLIGSSLMAEKDLNSAVRKVIFGENKVCGLTNIKDAQNAYENGAFYGGLIFAEKSKRKIDLNKAKEIVNCTPLNFVGVFQNQGLEFIQQIAHELKLCAVQLHGDENKEFIAELRQILEPNIEIWQAISVDIEQNQPIQITENPKVNKFILDSKNKAIQGGTGQSFDWNLIPYEFKQKIILAGGINKQNIKQALQQNCLGLDLNSGVEIAPGVKDEDKLKNIFQIIKGKI